MELADDPGERKMILAAMAPFRTPDCLAYVLSRLDDGDLRDEALVAAAKLAEGMKESTRSKPAPPWSACCR